MKFTFDVLFHGVVYKDQTRPLGPGIHCNLKLMLFSSEIVIIQNIRSQICSMIENLHYTDCVSNSVSLVMIYIVNVVFEHNNFTTCFVFV